MPRIKKRKMENNRQFSSNPAPLKVQKVKQPLPLRTPLPPMNHPPKATLAANLMRGKNIYPKTFAKLFEERKLNMIIPKAPLKTIQPLKSLKPIEKKEEIKLNVLQQKIYENVCQGNSVFYTGAAGTGKSFLLEQMIAHLQKLSRAHLAVTALTGVAAVNIGGQTLHSWAGILPFDETASAMVKRIRKNDTLFQRWKNVNVWIIDEISMCDGDLLDKLDHVAKELRACDLPFGGIQMIICGDFRQLSPVPNKNSKLPQKYAFEAKCWNPTFGKNCFELEEIVRQQQQEFVDILSNFRKLGPATSVEIVEKVKQKCCGVPLPVRNGIMATILLSHNAKVFQENTDELNKLPGIGYTYTPKYEGNSYYLEKEDQAQHLDCVTLKVGAQVMYTMNNSAKNLFNGSRGVVTGFTKDANPLPMVKFVGRDEDITVEFEQQTFHSDDTDPPSKTFLPLRLAWAITIHRSQGMSLDLVEIDISQVFSPGAAYVAMSRARTLEGLRIRGKFSADLFFYDPRVVKFYESIGFSC